MLLAASAISIQSIWPYPQFDFMLLVLGLLLVSVVFTSVWHFLWQKDIHDCYDSSNFPGFDCCDRSGCVAEV